MIPLTPLSHAILIGLADQHRHGYSLLAEVERALGEAGRPGTGTLYTALQRMHEDGLIEEVPAPEEGDARRRYYGLTELGRAVAVAETRRIARVVQTAVSKNLVTNPELLKGARS